MHSANHNGRIPLVLKLLQDAVPEAQASLPPVVLRSFSSLLMSAYGKSW